jgi:tetratricopeptide (TPR) repeat protein
VAALDDLGIPGNPHVFHGLQELLRTQRAIALVGAGASAGLYPLWGQLLVQLADEAVSRGLASDDDRSAWLRIAARNPQQAVRGIKERVGRQSYGAILAKIFGYRLGKDGRAFTPIHQLLMELPFRGYITTNYDPGLLEARSEFRPDVRATGYSTWRDTDVVRRWLTDDIFEKDSCPIMYAHGVYERSDTIVLGAGEYRDAYRPGLFRELLSGLWTRARLVFVGFGFSDTWFEVVAEQILTVATRDAAGEPRHIALIGLTEDEPYSPEIRHYYRDAYDAEVLLYSIRTHEEGGIRHEDHGALATMLEELVRPSNPSSTSDAVTAVRLPSFGPITFRKAAISPVPQRWMHETTEDGLYTEPIDVLARLDRWAADPSVRAIAVTGIGGLGKTALVGWWLKHRNGIAEQPVQGLFAWSFNADRQVANFFNELVAYAREEFHVAPPGRNIRAVDAAVAVLRDVPLVIVVDGLEVLQEPPGDIASEGPGRLGYGEFLDDDLRTFLYAACQLGHAGLVVMTSRFPFADLIGFLGTSLRVLQLEGLSARGGAELLARLDVKGSDEDLEFVSRRLNGHPLALRLLAAARGPNEQRDPIQSLMIAFGNEGLREEDPLETKVRQLVKFYETQLPAAWRALLGVVALFPDQVTIDGALALARQLPDVANQLEDISDRRLQEMLAALATGGLLTREEDETGEERYACHSVIRVHFRAGLVRENPQLARGAAGLLTGVVRAEITSLAELTIVTNAITLLLDARQIRQADDLYRERLDNGRVFVHLPAPRDGLACSLGFVADSSRRDRTRNQLSAWRLAFYLNSVGLFARDSADFELADSFLRDAAQLTEEHGDDWSLSICLQNRAALLIDLGHLIQAESDVRNALDLARSARAQEHERNTLALLGTVVGFQGRVNEALQLFQLASELEQRIDPDLPCLVSMRGVRWGDLLVRVGRIGQARQVTEWNLYACEQEHWRSAAALCHVILGRLDTLAGDWGGAASHLGQAAGIVRGAHLLPALPGVLVAQADLARHRHHWEEAEHHIEEAATIADTRRMSLYLAEALILRGRIKLDRGQLSLEGGNSKLRSLVEHGLDAADASLSIARRYGFPWAERDAARLSADAHTTLGNTQAASQMRRLAEQIADRLQSTDA